MQILKAAAGSQQLGTEEPNPDPCLPALIHHAARSAGNVEDRVGSNTSQSLCASATSTGKI